MRGCGRGGSGRRWGWGGEGLGGVEAVEAEREFCIAGYVMGLGALLCYVVGHLLSGLLKANHSPFHPMHRTN